jgi:hypothetical protein
VENIVTIKLDLQPVTLPYTVRIDPSIGGVKEYALEYPLTYILVFYTGDIEAVPDWSDPMNEKWAARVVDPFWVGNLDNKVVAIDQLVNSFLSEDGVDAWRMVE